jgi:hypothetical protein
MEIAMKKSGKRPSASSPLSEAIGALLTDESSAPRDERVPDDEQIRARAYELYLERGGRPGDDLGDWLRAEREQPERTRGARVSRAQ